jgi:hypothetical protein
MTDLSRVAPSPSTPASGGSHLFRQPGLLGTWRRKAVAAIVILVILAAGASAISTLMTIGTPLSTGPAARVSVSGNGVVVERAVNGFGGYTGKSFSVGSGFQLLSGDTITTPAGAIALITYSDGAVTRIDSLSEVSITIHAGSRSNSIDLAVNYGKIWADPKGGQSSFRVFGGFTGPSASVSGPATSAVFAPHTFKPGTTLRIDVFAGSMTAKVTGRSDVPVPQGQSVTLTADISQKGGPVIAPVEASPIPADDLQDPFVLQSRS